MASQVGPSRRIASFHVEGLFGLYNHDCILKLEDRVTILHGPNGVGKSALFRLVNALFSGKYSEFAFASFRKFRIVFTDATIFEVDGSEIVDIGSVNSLTFRIVAGNEISQFQVPLSNNIERVATLIERESPHIGRGGPGRWFDYKTAQAITSEDVVFRYGTEADLQSAIAIDQSQEPEELKALRSSLDVYLIETQRLLRQELNPRTERKNFTATVRTYSAELQNEIASTLAKYGAESQRLDQTFPSRLIARFSTAGTITDLKRSLEELDQRYTSLNNLGLVQQASYPVTPAQIDALDEVRRSVMALYVQDTGRKLDVLNNLAQKVRLLLVAVNQKFRNKALSINREHGLTVVDSKGRSLRLESLSSGEQHELVLWYDLLFRVRPNSLVLIDEPELSLHVSWQKAFLPELLDVVKAAGIDVILATHSPTIVGDRLDLMTALDAEPDV